MKTPRYRCRIFFVLFCLANIQPCFTENKIAILRENSAKQRQNLIIAFTRLHRKFSIKQLLFAIGLGIIAYAACHTARFQNIASWHFREGWGLFCDAAIPPITVIVMYKLYDIIAEERTYEKDLMASVRKLFAKQDSELAEQYPTAVLDVIKRHRLELPADGDRAALIIAHEIINIFDQLLGDTRK